MNFFKIKIEWKYYFWKIKNKNDLFDNFVIVNYENFQKPYLDSTFLSFLKNNEAIIKQYFGENTKYNQILEKIDYKEINSKKEELFTIFQKDINLDSNELIKIISSFYYLLFYKFNDIKKQKGRTNIGNGYINLILRTFVKFLAENIENLVNLIDILNELYSFDLANSDYKDNAKEIKSYSFLDIENLMSSCGIILTEKFELDKEEYKKENKKLMGLFQGLGERVFESINNIYLKAINKNVNSNTITIIIDILHKEDNEKEWANFIKYFEKESIFFFYKWSPYSKTYLLKSLKDDIIEIKSLAKLSGILLSDILLSNKLFNNFQINLICANLGANVGKYCIKDFAKVIGKKKLSRFKNIIFIGGAFHFKHEDKWKEYIKRNVIDRFINCYSTVDEKLKTLYSNCSKDKKAPFGIRPYELKDDKDINLITNVDFTEDKFDLSSYDYEKVAKKLFPKFKNI